MNGVERWRVPAALLAIASCVLAAVVAGQTVEGYSHLRHPLALLGARQLQEGAPLFGLFAFVLPGLIGGWIALGVRDRLPAGAGWSARIGAQLLVLAALAFAAQGVLPLDLDDLDGGSSRYHAAAWLLWALAFPAGATLLVMELWRTPGWRRFACITAVAALLVVAGGFLGSDWAGSAMSQRVAFAVWLAWGVFAAMPTPQGGVSRGAA
ncbi:DUF998 domain-containing protein [Pseudoxanthomonas daejeonensis]|uniref:DUF998 domain-containing protein n=1 Tax=Pseudoxanthomonas daejeonensis TaxID=266062 RepID=UPI001F544E3B|nr:DUF998 domain-containing protein [Pseudoxanthomonas daejeonensis]UNK57934.1 DUF998 domain-containing protein [Pseudoxanthomonas daejeonensis]